MNHNDLLRNAALILLYLTRIAYTIKCYKCSPVPRTIYNVNETVRLCSQFDHSDQFVVDCPYSTMCMKKVYSVNLTGNFTNGTHRDCAHQKFEYQKYVNGQWQLAVAIDKEPIAEGCLLSDGKGLKMSTTTYCYCQGDLCNGTVRIMASTILRITVIVMVFYILF